MALVVLSRHQAIVAVLLLLALIAPVALSLGWKRVRLWAAVAVSIALVSVGLWFDFRSESRPILPPYTFSLRPGTTVGYCIPAVTGTGARPPHGYKMAVFDVEVTPSNGPTTSQFSYDGIAQFTGKTWTVGNDYVETTDSSSIGKHVKLIAFVVSNFYAHLLQSIGRGPGSWSMRGPLPGTIPGTTKGSTWVKRGPDTQPC